MKLSFTCTRCLANCELPQARERCACGSSLYKVARREVPLINNQQSNVYRDKKSVIDSSDGNKMTTPGGEGDISGSGLGQNSRSDSTGQDVVGDQHNDETMSQNHVLPQDQDAFDPYADPSPDSGQYSVPGSENSMDDNSPLNPRNKMYEPKHTGPFNMPHNSRVPSIYNAMKGRNVYDRIKQRVKGK
jgi:hypothetical protein